MYLFIKMPDEKGNSSATGCGVRGYNDPIETVTGKFDPLGLNGSSGFDGIDFDFA